MEIREWLATMPGFDGISLEPASSDASFRRYFRLRRTTGSVILMDAPPDREDCRPFIHVCSLLGRAGVHVPQILAQDLDRGFLLLSDLGSQTYLEVMTEANADRLYSDAIDALLRWQLASRAGELPAYDDALLRRELNLFPDWYLARHLQVELSGEEKAVLEGAFSQLVSRALRQPQVYVHRDYMPRNLMLSEPNPGVLDFQDAVYGPISYDVMSLFKDAFLSWDESRVREWLRLYWSRAKSFGLPVGDFDDFHADFEWMGLQRHFKVIGIFARICYRDGKPRYLEDTPRFLRYIREVLPRYPELSALRRLMERIDILAEQRKVAR
jgi:aminoglycoside/choline kinase family phosphotransferase